MNNKIKFDDLSGWLKVLVVYGSISLIISALSFIAGFVVGFTGAIN